MLFTGSFARTLDDKLRVGLPKSLRDEWDPDTEAGYLGPGTDGSLALYAPSVFSQLARELGAVSATGADVRAFGRLFYAQVQRVDFDSLGRLRIPAELARWAKLEKEVMLLGVRDHVEIWDRGAWEQYLGTQQGRYDEIADAAFRASVARPANA
ncbi:MAG: hypothetical protein U0939_15705 [Pirellulales bacterium]